MAVPTCAPAARLARRGTSSTRCSRTSRPYPRWCSPARHVQLTAALGRVADRSRRSCCRPATAPSPSSAFSADSIRERLRVILQMAVVLTYSAGVPAVKVGRIAGPVRQATLVAGTETVDGVELPSFRGHMVNDIAFDRSCSRARPPPPPRGLQPVGVHAEPAAGLHQGRLRRPRPGCTSGTRSSSRPARRAAATSSSRTRSTGPCGSCEPAASTPTRCRPCTRSTSTPATRRSCWATRRR